MVTYIKSVPGAIIIADVIIKSGKFNIPDICILLAIISIAQRLVPAKIKSFLCYDIMYKFYVLNEIILFRFPFSLFDHVEYIHNENLMYETNFLCENYIEPISRLRYLLKL